MCFPAWPSWYLAFPVLRIPVSCVTSAGTRLVNESGTEFRDPCHRNAAEREEIEIRFEGKGALRFLNQAQIVGIEQSEAIEQVTE